MRYDDQQIYTEAELIDMCKSMSDEIENVYRERNKVVAALAHVLNHNNVKVGVATHDLNDKAWNDEWRTIVVIELPAQVTWHFHDSEKYLLKGLPEIKDYKWDGHSTEEKYKRLLEFFI